MAARTWKPIRPAHSIGHATEMCLEEAMRRKNRSMKTVAGLMGMKYDTLHAWLGEWRMPVCKVAAFEHACGAHYLSDFLAAQAGRLVVATPSRRATALDLAALQVLNGEVLTLLMRCYQSQATPQETADALTGLICELAFHRANVARMDAPELDLFGSEE